MLLVFERRSPVISETEEVTGVPFFEIGFFAALRCGELAHRVQHEKATLLQRLEQAQLGQGLDRVQVRVADLLSRGER